MTSRTLANAMSKAAAEREAVAIRQYWSKRGHHPKVWVAIVLKNVTETDSGAVTSYGYGVRSDMHGAVPDTVNGLFVDSDMSREALRGVVRRFE